MGATGRSHWRSMRTTRSFLYVAAASLCLAILYTSRRPSTPPPGVRPVNYPSRTQPISPFRSGLNDFWSPPLDNAAEHPSLHAPSEGGSSADHEKDALSTTLVVGCKKGEEDGVRWIWESLRDVSDRKIYVVDDPNAPLSLKRNKGREAMVYLRYILDHYDKLDDVTLFYHSGRKAWHNNILFNKDAAVMINNLRRKWVVEQGYMPARCELYPGCPQWIIFDPTKEQHRLHLERNSDLFTEKLWNQLFPNNTYRPTHLSQPCCSQFAASRDMIRSVPLEQYRILHDWLGTTNIPDGYTGRVMEYAWQFLFLKKAEHCPNMGECYCKGYGLCLEDYSELERYNSLRFKDDEILTKLGEWDKEQGCHQIEDKKEKDKCKSHNPWIKDLNEERKEKWALEAKMLEKYGIKDA